MSPLLARLRHSKIADGLPLSEAAYVKMLLRRLGFQPEHVQQIIDETPTRRVRAFKRPRFCLAGRRGRHGNVRRGCPKFEGSIATGAIR
jgi:hypothetical protein